MFLQQLMREVTRRGGEPCLRCRSPPSNRSRPQRSHRAAAGPTLRAAPTAPSGAKRLTLLLFLPLSLLRLRPAGVVQQPGPGQSPPSVIHARTAPPLRSEAERAEPGPEPPSPRPRSAGECRVRCARGGAAGGAGLLPLRAAQVLSFPERKCGGGGGGGGGEVLPREPGEGSDRRESREEGSVWVPGEASGGDGSGCGKGRGCGTAACGEPGRIRPRRRAGRRRWGERSEELRGCPAAGWGGRGPPHRFVAGRKPPASALRRNGGCGQGGRLAPSRRGSALRRTPHLGRLGLSAAGGARRLRGGRLRPRASLMAIRAPCGGKRPEKLPSGPQKPSGGGRAEAPALLCGSRTRRRGRGQSLAGASNWEDERNLIRAPTERSPGLLLGLRSAFARSRLPKSCLIMGWLCGVLCDAEECYPKERLYEHRGKCIT